MPAQTQASTLAQKLGKRITEAHLEHKDAPVNSGRQQLPAGIKGGVAKLNSAYIKPYAADAKEEWMRGAEFFRASGIVVAPKVFNGQTCEGGVTSIMVPLCDVPAKGNRKAKSFNDHWFDFQNWFKQFGVAAPTATDPAAILNYYQAAMKMLAGDPTDKTKKHKPVYFTFSTRGWTPPKTPLSPNPTEMVFEEWHGIDTNYHPNVDPSTNGVVDHTAAPPDASTEMAPGEPFTEPLMGVVEEPTGQPSDAPSDIADLVLAYVTMADDALTRCNGEWDENGKPKGATPDEIGAIDELTQMAKNAGATDEQVQQAANYAAVGEMALGIFPDTTPPVAETATPTVGSKWNYLRRTKDGKVLQNKDKPFPPIQVDVATVDPATKTVTVTSAGKPVTAPGGKTPMAVKWEWLEPIK